MAYKKNTQGNRFGKPAKRVLLTGETREEEAARLAREIAAHPVTKCEPGEYTPTTRPGWSNKAFIPQKDQAVAEDIAKKMMRKPKK